MQPIINGSLKWDGSHLGNYPPSIITQIFTLYGDSISYYSLTLPLDWSAAGLPAGMIHCNAHRTKDAFPCIVEEIKDIFGIHRRGVHRITIGKCDYILYHVPISPWGEIIWEPPLTRLDIKHPLRRDPRFRKEVQRLIAFCDILALTRTGEPSIRIRPGDKGKGYIPINTNDSATTITKGVDYDFSILSKTIFSKWFGETVSINEIVSEMVGYRIPHPKIAAVHPIIRIPNFCRVVESGVKLPELTPERLTIICAEIRNKIDLIIKRYDSQYSWYSCFIIDRMSRHLLSLIESSGTAPGR